MQYRDLGKTGIKVSALGFGAMRLPADPDVAVAVIQRALDQGVNYIDTAYGYKAGEEHSEVIVGRAVKGRRDQVWLSSKQPLHDWGPEKEKKPTVFYLRRLEESLKRMQVDCIDVYHMHDMRLKVFEERAIGQEGALKVWLKARDEGLIRHIAFSCHDTPENIKKLIDTGYFGVMTVQYNLLDRSNEEAIAYAYEKGVGVVVMGPVGGGRLGTPSEIIQSMLPGKVQSTPEMALRFVLDNKKVSTAISGMNSVVMVDENVATASRDEPLSNEERQRIAAILEEKKRLADLYCTGCNYCMPCENGVDIPRNFQLMNYYRIYDLKEYARKQYAALEKNGKWAKVCQECGECEAKCPQEIPIIEQLKETDKTLG